MNSKINNQITFWRIIKPNNYLILIKSLLELILMNLFKKNNMFNYQIKIET